MYGETILKPIETETVVKTGQDFHKDVCLNYKYVQSSIKVGDRYYIKNIKTILIISSTSIAV